MSEKIKNIFFSALRFVIGFGLAAFIIRKIIRDSKVDLVYEFNHAITFFLLIAFCLYGSLIVFGIFRWRLLLRVLNIKLSLWALTKLTMIGQFFNLAVPGAVGGDVLKMVYIRKHTGDKTAEAVLTIFLDRILGIFGLIVVAAVTVLISIPYLKTANSDIQTSAIAVGVVSACAITSVLMVFFHEAIEKLPGVSHAIKFGQKKLPDKICEIIKRFVNAVDMYRDSRMDVVTALFMSVCVHSLFASMVICLGKAFHDSAVPIKQYFLATQIANIAGAIPLFPGGLGGRDIVLKTLLTTAGGKETTIAAIAIFVSVIIIIWSLIGGLIFIFSNNSADQTSETDDPLASATETTD